MVRCKIHKFPEERDGPSGAPGSVNRTIKATNCGHSIMSAKGVVLRFVVRDGEDISSS